ncbi:UDP-N-acetylmuramate dehydrogenase [Savagea sp. SN6]|uniref:UDP-N-acetylenolpyruvoylglucosamine reductase n=1 Tax=Savagea serpentis TaxID=2785297 RepID=A0A8J7GCG5_9BACL|nr:UDP-N-acetylmuramate dehydrogenase [Savagea serpentis]MBF4501126.1 UDP-N-acetylmuramate dehydrogenase [Savagea serpentis]
MYQSKVEELRELVSEGIVLQDEHLHKYTKTALGGAADLFVMPQTIEECQAVVKYAFENDIPLLLLGNGSNMVVRDGGVRGIVLHLAKLNAIEVKGTDIYAEAGAHLIDVSKTAATHSLTGFEFACGIPGSIGGGMMMNAGAYGGEMKDIVVSVQVLTKSGELLTLTKDELQLGYRTSIIQTEGYYVMSALFSLEVGVQAEIDEKIADLTYQRESKQPLEYPSAGSVFKRPPGHFAGKLIQDSGLQGKGFGGAEVSTKHAGFIVNKNNATATDYVNTIRMVREEVKRRYGIELELEVRIVGEE